MIYMFYIFRFCFFLSSRRRHTRCALVTGVQTCALPICVFADAEPQSTVSSESNRLDRALRSLQIADDPTRIDKEGPPDLGEADAAAYAFEQLNPKFRFESSDSARDIWRVDTKPCRGTPKGEFLGSHNERPNLNQIQRLDPNIARGEGNKLAARLRRDEHCFR